MNVLDRAALENQLCDVRQQETGTPENKPPSCSKPPYKYSEDECLEELRTYINGTYKEHYVDPKTNIQVLDLLNAIGIADTFSQGSAIKYLSRLGRKNGLNRKDLLKAAHYCILLMHFTKE